MVRLTLGTPEYGWLPVHFQVQEYSIELEVSDVPVNPLEELCSAIISIAHGESAEVNWHLEPVWYHFRFETSNEVVALTILASERYGLKADVKFSTTGTFDSLIMPFYRALNGFLTTDYGTYWPTVDSAGVTRLTALIKARNKQA